MVKNKNATLILYAIAHAVIDAISVALVFSTNKNNFVTGAILFSFVILYNVIAFGFQPIFGLLIDRVGKVKIFLLSSYLLMFTAILLLGSNPLLTVILVAIANAIFHLSAGSVAINITPGKATAPGIFVGPGAAGLLYGTLLGKAGTFDFTVFSVFLIILALLTYLAKEPEMDYQKEEKLPNGIVVVFILIFIAVLARSYIGFAVAFPWKTNLNLVYLLTAAIVFGKMAGGYIADKFGWSKVALISLITSAVLITFCRNLPVLAITGMFFFQFPMAITLAAMAKIFKGRPAFAFGLTCLALVVGAYPSLVSKNLSFPALNFIIVVVTGLFLWIGMNILDKMYLKEKIKIS